MLLLYCFQALRTSEFVGTMMLYHLINEQNRLATQSKSRAIIPEKKML